MTTISKRSGLVLLLAALAGLAMLFAACGGDDDDNTNTSATATSSGHATATQKPDANATKTEEATKTPAGTEDVLSELESLGKDIKQVTGKVSYDSTDTEAGGTPVTTTMTFYSKEPNSRFDSTDENGSTTTVIYTTDTTYICTVDDETCIGEPNTGGDPTSALGLFGGFFSGQLIDALIAEANAQGIDVTKSSESVAGTDATCYSGNDNGDIGKFCFSDSGLLLLTQEQSADGSSTELKATSFSNDVSASDFEPPYPVMTIPGQ